jgi:hypothetical protein
MVGPSPHHLLQLDLAAAVVVVMDLMRQVRLEGVLD